MSITGAHVVLYSSEAVELRRLLSEVFDWSSVDAGDGWLIYALPPAEVAVHPADKPAHELTLMCDDLTATMRDLSERGVLFDGEPQDEGWGVVVPMVLPGDLRMLLYEPRHPTALDR